MSPELKMIVVFTICIGTILATVIYMVKSAHNKAEAEKAAWMFWATHNNFSYNDTLSRSYLSFSSFDDGALSRSVTGVLPQSGNRFALALQTEERGSGRNHRIYKRTITAVDIPDTKLHVIINSKINNDAMSGGNIAGYSDGQRFSLEGDFGDFYDVYMPATTQSETLSMLTPDSMLYVLENLADYDIEINGPKLYLYKYSHMNAKQVSELIVRVDSMLKEMRLRLSDARTQPSAKALVARTATAARTHRSLKKDFNVLGALFIIGYVAINMTQHPIANVLFLCIFFVVFGKVVQSSVRERRLKKKYKRLIAHTNV